MTGEHPRQVLDYRSPEEDVLRRCARMTLLLRWAAVAPYVALIVSLSLESIDYFAPGIPFYPWVFILMLMGTAVLEGTCLLLALRWRRRLAPWATHLATHVRVTTWIAGFTVAAVVISWGAMLWSGFGCFR